MKASTLNHVRQRLTEQLAESAKLEAEIKRNSAGLGYES